MKRKQIPPETVQQIEAMSIVDLCHQYGIAIKKVGSEYRIVDKRIVSDKEMSSLAVCENKFFRHSDETERGGVIQFYINYIRPELQYMDKADSFYLACTDLIEEIGETILQGCENVCMERVRLETSTLHQSFAPDCKRVVAYLCKSRMIDYQIIRPLLMQKLLRQDERGNACFCRYGNGRLTGIEKHGTNTFKPFRITEGRKGFFLNVGKPETVCLFESAIDLLSFRELFANRLKAHLLVSMGGLNGLAEEVRQQYPNARIFLCVDNDEAGNQFADRLKGLNMQKFQTRNVKDWNDLLKLHKNKQKNFTKK
jgi:hypothetical protein